jgi:hypothetical protein
MRKLILVALAILLVTRVSMAQSEDLAGSKQLLCAAAQATVCVEDGECVVDLPWNLNVPAFIEVDLDKKTLATTAASDENRTTAIEHLDRRDGIIVFHGFEMGQAFSWVIDEKSGRVAVAIAADGAAVSVFGTCTPIDAGRAGDAKGASR